MSRPRHINAAPLLHLLPGSISSDPGMTATSLALDNPLHAAALSIPQVLLFARLQAQCAGQELPMLPPMQRLATARGGLTPLSTPLLELLAWQFHVDFREVAHTDMQLAEMVLQSIPWHRIKGTPASIINAMALFGYTATIEEDGTGQHWATYQLGLPQIADVATVKKILSIAQEMQPARCRLWRMYTDVFDRRPIILSIGPPLGDGWLSYHSGVPVETPGGDVIVSFGTKNSFQSEAYALRDSCASFGTTTWLGLLAPYLDVFTVGRSRLSDVYPRNKPFVIGSFFSILWADRETRPRSWRGEWDARSWRDYTGFDRKLPRWRMGRREISASQLVPSWPSAEAGLSDQNSRLGVTFATVINAPPRLGNFRLSAHDPQRLERRLHEMFLVLRFAATPAVNPAQPQTAGSALVSESTALREARRSPWAVQSHQALRVPAGSVGQSPPATALASHLALTSLAASPTPEIALHSLLGTGTCPLHNRQWKGSWKGGRRWWDYVAFVRIGEYTESPEASLLFDAQNGLPPFQPCFADRRGTSRSFCFDANPALVSVKTVFASAKALAEGLAVAPLFRDRQGRQHRLHFRAHTLARPPKLVFMQENGLTLTPFFTSPEGVEREMCFTAHPHALPFKAVFASGTGTAVTPLFIDNQKVEQHIHFISNGEPS